MGPGSVAATAAAVIAVVGGAVLLSSQPAEAPKTPAPQVAARTARVEYNWPTGEKGDVVGPFAAPSEPWAAGHRGVDLELANGTPVRTSADGVVAFAGKVAGRGVVSIDHADGVRTTYEPVSAVVGRGEQVSGGQVVGRIDGLGHCAPDHCLHWGARRGPDDYLDPLSLVTEEVVIRLLPHHRGAPGHERANDNGDLL